MAEFLTPYQTSKILEGVIPADMLVRPNFLQSAFGSVKTVNADTVNFDIEFGIKSVAAMYVSPDADAPLIKLQGFGTKEMRFAYLKEGLSGADYEEINSRQLGQQFGATQNIMANYVANLQQKLAITEQRFENRFELTARDLIFYGKYTAESALHPKVLYDYGRTVATTDAEYLKGFAPELNLATLNGNGGVGKRAWDATGGTAAPTPVVDFVKACKTCLRKSNIRMAIMSSDAYDLFEQDIRTNYADTWDLNKSVSDRTVMRIMPVVDKYQDVNYRMSYPLGNGTSVDIYTLDSVLNNRTTGAEEAIVPNGYMAILPSTDRGYKVYGKIMHLKSGYTAQPRFINSWEDPKSGKLESEIHSNYLMGIPQADAFVSWHVML